jgi:hypothetical protein
LIAKRLRIAHPIPTAFDAMDTIHAHSRNFNTPIARDTVTLARISREHPPAIPIPAIATEVGCPASPPDMPITATKKKPKEPRARIAAPQNVRTAMIVTPVGRFTLWPYLSHRRRSRVKRLL